MNLTSRELSLLVASMKGSISRMEPNCPMWDEVNDLSDLLVTELMERNL